MSATLPPNSAPLSAKSNRENTQALITRPTPCPASAGLQHAGKRAVQAQHQVSFFNARERNTATSKNDSRMSQEGLVSHLVQSGNLKSDACINAMLNVDRALFVDLGQMPRNTAYQVRTSAGMLLCLARACATMCTSTFPCMACIVVVGNAMKWQGRRGGCQNCRCALQDVPLPNGPTETVSAPHMHAIALELLADKLTPGSRVLDVGSVCSSLDNLSVAVHSAFLRLFRLVQYALPVATL